MVTDKKAKVRVNGQEYQGWTGVVITGGIEEAARSFQLSTTGSPIFDDAAIDIIENDAIEVYLGDDLVVTGYVETVEITYDQGSHSRRIAGRSKTCDLIDCSSTHNTGQFRNFKPVDVIRTLSRPFGIRVVESESWSPIGEFEVEHGEAILQAAHRLGDLRAFLVTDDAHGNLNLTRAGATRATDAVTKLKGNGSNVLAGTIRYSTEDRYSEVIARGQRKGTDDDFGEAATLVEARATDETVTRPRSLVVTVPGNATLVEARARAEWEITARLGNAMEVRATVQGWHQTDGSIWQVNQIVRYRDDFANLDQDMIISAIEYSLTSDGSFTQLFLKRPEAFVPQPAIKKDTSAKGQGVNSQSGKKEVQSLDISKPEYDRINNRGF